MSLKRDEQAIQDLVSENYEHLRHQLPYARTYHEWAFRTFASLIDPPLRAGRVLDNGCGVGRFFDYLSDDHQAYGVDLSGQMLAKARQRHPQVAQSDSTRLPFAEATFDLVFALSLLHHLPQPLDGLAEIARVLRPGGQVVLVDTNRSLLSTLPRHLAYRRDNFSDDHANLHRSDYLRWIQTHFTLKQVRFIGYLAYPFGFPDMMGPLRRIAYPPSLIRALIHADNWLSRVPYLKTQSWWIAVTAVKP